MVERWLDSAKVRNYEKYLHSGKRSALAIGRSSYQNCWRRKASDPIQALQNPRSKKSLHSNRINFRRAKVSEKAQRQVSQAARAIEKCGLSWNALVRGISTAADGDISWKLEPNRERLGGALPSLDPRVVQIVQAVILESAVENGTDEEPRMKHGFLVGR